MGRSAAALTSVLITPALRPIQRGEMTPQRLSNQPPSVQVPRWERQGQSAQGKGGSRHTTDLAACDGSMVRRSNSGPAVNPTR